MSAPIQPDRNISTERTLLQAQKDASGKTVGYTLYLRVTHAEGRDRVMKLSTKDTDLERIFKTAMTIAKLAYELSYEDFGSRFKEGSRMVVTNLDKGYTLQSAFGLRIQERDSALWYEATTQRNASYLGGTTGFELADSRKGRRWYNNIDRVLGEEGFKESLIGSMPSSLTSKIKFLRNAVESQSSMIPKMVAFWSEALDGTERMTEQEMQLRFNSWFDQTTQGPQVSLQDKLREKGELLEKLRNEGGTAGQIEQVKREGSLLLSRIRLQQAIRQYDADEEAGLDSELAALRKIDQILERTIQKTERLRYLQEATPSGTTRGTIQEIERVQKEVTSLEQQLYGVELGRVASILEAPNVKDAFENASATIQTLTTQEEFAKKEIETAKKEIAELRYRRSAQGLSALEDRLSRYQALQEYAAAARTEVVRRARIVAEIYSEQLYTTDMGSQVALGTMLDSALSAISRIQAMPTGPTRSQIKDGYALITDAWHREAINQSGWQPRLEGVIVEGRRNTIEALSMTDAREKRFLIGQMEGIRPQGRSYNLRDPQGGYTSLGVVDSDEDE